MGASALFPTTLTPVSGMMSKATLVLTTSLELQEGKTSSHVFVSRCSDFKKNVMKNGDGQSFCR